MMNLTYLTRGKQPSDSLKSLFDNVRIIEIKSIIDLHRQVGPVETEMREKGSVKFDVDDFVLCDNSLSDLGRVIARNRFNYGVVDGKNNPADVGERQIYPMVKFGDTAIGLSHALKLPFKEKQRILCVSPHYEEEATLFPAYLHKQQGDEVRLIVVTPIPQKENRPDLERITHEVYRDILGFTPGEYQFLNLPDGKVAEHRAEFESAFEKALCDFEPNTVITTPTGSNFDHNTVANSIQSRTPGKLVNLLYGNVLQNMQFRPNLFPVVDESVRELLADTFSGDKIGSGPDHKPTIDRLFETGFPEPLNRYIGTLVESGKYTPQQAKGVGVYALQAVHMTRPYSIPSKTHVFDK